MKMHATMHVAVDRIVVCSSVSAAHTMLFYYAPGSSAP